MSGRAKVRGNVSAELVGGKQVLQDKVVVRPHHLSYGHVCFFITEGVVEWLRKPSSVDAVRCQAGILALLVPLLLHPLPHLLFARSQLTP